MTDVIDGEFEVVAGTRVSKVQWFEFRQNNTGGSFDIDDNVSEYVFIQAVDYKHANQRAEEIGIYFDGCAIGRDCPCCGDRWNELGVWGADEGTDEIPLIYSWQDDATDKWIDYKRYRSDYCGAGEFPIILHYIDGHVERAGSGKIRRLK